MTEVGRQEGSLIRAAFLREQEVLPRAQRRTGLRCRRWPVSNPIGTGKQFRVGPASQWSRDQ